MIRIILFFGTAFLLTACQLSHSNIDDQNDSYPEVDQRLWTFFQNFENEAAQRGVNVDLRLSEITGEISNIQDEGVAGTCQHGTHIHHVTVDLEFWNNASFLLREYVVFHELGHCFLSRDHSEIQDNNGNCLSIMQSGTSGCNLVYNSNSRSPLIDELFTNF